VPAGGQGVVGPAVLVAVQVPDPAAVMEEGQAVVQAAAEGKETVLEVLGSVRGPETEAANQVVSAARGMKPAKAAICMGRAVMEISDQQDQGGDYAKEDEIGCFGDLFIFHGLCSLFSGANRVPRV
jgi:hypothetical protein